MLYLSSVPMPAISHSTMSHTRSKKATVGVQVDNSNSIHRLSVSGDVDRAANFPGVADRLSEAGLGD